MFELYSIVRNKQGNTNFRPFRRRAKGEGYCFDISSFGFIISLFEARLCSNPIVNDARRYQHAATQLLPGSMALEPCSSLANELQLFSFNEDDRERERDYCNLIHKPIQPLARG